MSGLTIANEKSTSSPYVSHITCDCCGKKGEYQDAYGHMNYSTRPNTWLVRGFSDSNVDYHFCSKECEIEWEKKKKQRIKELLIPRDEKRINIILDKIRILWKKYPDLRFCQLISNLTRPRKDIFYLEDDEFLELLENPNWEYKK